MEDGTVLKLSQRHCAGIGDGWRKIQREVNVLQAIESLRTPPDLRIARVVGWGEHYSQDSVSGTHDPLWLQMTKVSGRGRTVADLRRLSSEERNAIAISIACTLAKLHTLLNQAVHKLTLMTASENLRMIRHEIREDSEGADYTTRLLQALSQFGNDSSSIIHGDFNISNVLFEQESDKTEVCAVVDFAETRWGFVEEDLAAIVKELPAYRRPLLEAFEKTTGYDIRRDRLHYGLALSALLSFVIAKRLESREDREYAKRRLKRYLTLLESA